VRDLDAVIQRLKLEKFSIFAASYSGPLGIRFTALNADRVERLILWCTHAHYGDVVAKLPSQSNQQRVAVNQLAGVDRDLFIRTYLHRAIGWTEGETANRFVEVAKQSIDEEHFFENLANYAAFDARADLPNVSTPTLVFHRPAFVGSHVDVAKSLASRMPNARLVLSEGESVAPFVGDTQSILDACTAFLDEDGAGRQGNLASTIRTIFYTDLEAHTPMLQRLGDERGREVLREHERVIRGALRDHGGEEMKTFGDGFLAAFGSTQQALRCAIALQKTFDELQPLHGERPRLRVGINAGEPISEDDALHGQAVSLAANLVAGVEGGRIVVSGVVRELVAGKGFEFRPMGESSFAGADGPIQLYEVEWRQAVTR
jgi:class 3 adenylate cyclase